MSYQQPDLTVVYEPTNSWCHFVLYAEPGRGAVGAGLNANVSIEQMTPYAREWVRRLQRCRPDPLHTTLVAPRDIPDLFHPCVHEDKNSPAAIAGDGCTCKQTWTDPEYGFPVVAEHFRTVSGNIETWKYRSYAPLDLRTQDKFSSLIVDPLGMFWIRTEAGVLSLLPEGQGRGYGVGYGGGGPSEFARYVQKLIESNGQDMGVCNGYADDSKLDSAILAWAQSKAANRRQELTLPDLRKIQQG
ncbi:hypothetical protein [Streptomyces sp. NPDC017964]|uniref:hypothetical protein n=1 Tax=Streptomyces sp. NPDC017964 TaxID=3365022 RepID=UPI003791E07A